MIFADDVTFWGAVGGAAGTGLAGGIALILLFLRKAAKAKFDQWEHEGRVKREIAKQKHLDVIDRNWRIQSTTERLCAVAGVDRVLVLRGSNGGALPRIDTPYRVSCLYGHPQKAEDIYEGPIRVDAAYMRMIQRICTLGVVTMTFRTMKDGTLLKEFYRREGVVQSRVYFLSLGPTRLLICSVASYTHEFTVDEIALIDAAVNVLRGQLDSDPMPPAAPPTLEKDSDEWADPLSPVPS